MLLGKLFDLRHLGFSGQTRKIELLEELVNIGSKTGEWGNPLLTGRENSLAAMNMNRNPHTLDRETLEALKNRHDANAWKAFNHWLENGGTDIILGAMILGTATGVRTHSDIQAKKETAGAQESGGASKGGSDAVSVLWKKALKHPLNRHMPSKVVEQFEYMNETEINNYFNNVTFFNKLWTEKQVTEALNYGYQEAVSKGVSNGKYSFTYKGEKITVYLHEGTFSTGYGHNVYTYKEIMSSKGRQ